METRTTQEWKKFRKRLLVNPAFQFSFMKYILGIALGTVLIFYVAKVLFFRQLSSELGTLGFGPDHAIFGMVTNQSRRMDGILAAAAVIEALFLTWMGLRLSHRVAGPLLRLKNEMLRTAQGGEVTPLKFRDGDYFEDLAEAYNQQAKKR
jgi:hypothetical protein